MCGNKNDNNSPKYPDYSVLNNQLNSLDLKKLKFKFNFF